MLMLCVLKGTTGLSWVVRGVLHEADGIIIVVYGLYCQKCAERIDITIEVFSLISLSVCIAVRERPRCSSRTTALLFAKSSAALREQQQRTMCNSVRRLHSFFKILGA